MGDKIFIHGYAILVLACMHPIWRNIHNSVNYPNCDMGICGVAGRIAINHKNVVNMISQFATVLGGAGMNISDMTNKSKGDYAYTLIDLETPATQEIIDKLDEIEGVLKVRIIK